MAVKTSTDLDKERIADAIQQIRNRFTAGLITGFTGKELSKWIQNQTRLPVWYYHNGFEKLKRDGLVDKVGDQWFILGTPRCCPTCKRPFLPGKGVGIKLD